jgi:CxxC motif-containing protein (DUF1111 family)
MTLKKICLPTLACLVLIVAWTVRAWTGKPAAIESGPIATSTGAPAATEPGLAGDKESLAQGKELFTHEWVAGDRLSHAGDGLGPVYNAQSCAACHRLGGIGGAGSNETNVS